MSCFALDRKAADAVIQDMNKKIFEYTKRLAATKATVFTCENTLHNAVANTAFYVEAETALAEAKRNVQQIQDCIDCFTLIRTYCEQLIERVSGTDKMSVLLLNADTLNIEKTNMLMTQHDDRDYVTDADGNKFYRALYTGLTAEEYTRLEQLIGEDTVQHILDAGLHK